MMHGQKNIKIGLNVRRLLPRKATCCFLGGGGLMEYVTVSEMTLVCNFVHHDAFYSILNVIL
jgi:hypothetical protein